MKLLIKTDKNGTKYWQDDTCDRCFGRGYIVEFDHVEGGVCFKCDGSGTHIRNWKEYTPEYQAILDARRIARYNKKEAEFKAHIADHYKALGLDENGHAFAVLAKTFGHQAELKAAGARFNGEWWYFNHAEEAWDTAEIDAVPMLEVDPAAGVCRWDEWGVAVLAKKAVSEILAKRRTAANLESGSEFYGTEGEKVQVNVTITGLFSFQVADHFSYQEDATCTMYGYKMRDAENHYFVWMTTSRHPAELLQEAIGNDFVEDKEGHLVSIYSDPELVRSRLVGMNATIKATIKGHQEREGLKETKLTRCRFTFAA